MNEDYMTIVLEDKIYSQRTENSKFVEFDLKGTKIQSFEELPQEIKDIIELNKKIEETPDLYLNYETYEDGIQINEILPKAGTHVKIPKYINGLPVIKLKHNVLVYTKDQVRQLMLPETIKEFSEETFIHAHALRHINIPSNIKKIPKFCFYDCYFLNNVSLKNIEFIDDSAFCDCMSLSSVNLSNAVLINCQAFCGCSALRKVTLSDNLAYLGTSAFHRCRSLERIEIPDKIKELEKFTFSGCISLKEIKFPEGLVSIGENCFLSCDSLKTFTAPETLKIIKNSAFADSGLRTVKLNKELKAIEAYVFRGCSQIIDFEIYENTTYGIAAIPSKVMHILREIPEKKEKNTPNYTER